ncbi:hypothetical protein NQ317_013024 [Molorchus minor]|uniref:Ubiquitin-like modifier-activating enzyme ATG7 n=1 Tax=Molorchus minor TaxID=1323400 RepID=A0ABQ9K3C1_9CUCU|nr:hypothetical protein NQ317_013024 [Molorchus minor]
MSELLAYNQLTTSVDPSFWNKFTEIKLNVDRLDETQHHIWGYFNSIPSEDYIINLMEIDSTSFNHTFEGQNIYLPFHGKLINKNTIENFKECDKAQLINDEGQLLYKRIVNDDVLQDPSTLNYFLVLSFAVCNKVLISKNTIITTGLLFLYQKGLSIENAGTSVITNEFSINELQTLYEEYKKLEYSQRTYFLVEKAETGIGVYSLGMKIKQINVESVKNFYFVFYEVSNNLGIVRTQLKNYATLIMHYCKFLQGNCANFIAFHLSREKSCISCKQSTIYRLKLPYTEKNITWVGWEKNERDKMGPRLANMKNTLDPHVIAESSVDLNLKLMKWRVLPQINLEIIKTTRCLLLGSGTLGCSVARSLLAWGVRNITLVDNSTVSFSNPVRQSLFTFQDSVQMAPKALAAAENLKTIFPGVIVINAALGFDTYLVMRHGIRDTERADTSITNLEGFKSINGTKLGCYFCNDVTAPGNSTRDRTLDQQCTVTRPGVSQIAGALAVELAISILQHKEGAQAPAFYKSSQSTENDITDTENQSLLGLVPHSIRGFLSSFEHILPATQKYEHCVACSDAVIKNYEENGFEFLLKVFNSSKHLEDVTHLTEMFKETDFGEILEFSDNEDGIFVQ